MQIKNKKLVRLVVKITASALNLFKKEFLRKPNRLRKKEMNRYEQQNFEDNRYDSYFPR